MALLFIESWDHYDTTSDKWDLTPGSTLAPYIKTAGRFAGNALEIADNTINEVTKFITPSDEVIVGCAVKFTGTHDWQIYMEDENGTDLCSFRQIGTGGAVRTGSSSSAGAGTLVGTYVNAYTTSTWMFLEVRYKASATVGEVEVRVNGVLVFSATGLNTSSTLVERVNFKTNYQHGGSTLIDDVYMLDTTGAAPQNNFLGDVRVSVLYPKANGTVNNFTPSIPGTVQWQMVSEEIHDADGTYVEAGQLGAKEDYNNQEFSDIGLAPGNIYGVQVVNSVRKTDAGGINYRNQMVINGFRYDDGVDVIAPASLFKMTTYIRDTDPSDGQAWTEGKVDATGSGFEITFREV